MGMDPITIGVGVGALGSLWSAYSGSKAASQQNKRQTQLYSNATSQMQNGPSDIEKLLMSQFQQGQGQLNMGQDSILQSMRTNPYDKILQSNLGGMLGGNEQYNLSPLFGAIEQRGQRNLGLQIADSRAGVSGLGQRFGGAQTYAEGDLRRKFLEDTSLNEQNIGLQSYQQNQQNRLGAAGALTNFGNLQLGRDTGALNAMQMMDQGKLQWLNSIMQAQGQRQNYNLGLTQAASGLPFAQNTGAGAATSDIGQLLFLYGLMNKKPAGLAGGSVG